MKCENCNCLISLRCYKILRGLCANCYRIKLSGGMRG